MTVNVISRAQPSTIASAITPLSPRDRNGETIDACERLLQAGRSQ
jgi:hypothetical protein